jgi:hypothetical protein
MNQIRRGSILIITFWRMMFTDNDTRSADSEIRPCKNNFWGIKKITLRTYRSLNDCLNNNNYPFFTNVYTCLFPFSLMIVWMHLMDPELLISNNQVLLIAVGCPGDRKVLLPI